MLPAQGAELSPAPPYHSRCTQPGRVRLHAVGEFLEALRALELGGAIAIDRRSTLSFGVRTRVA